MRRCLIVMLTLTTVAGAACSKASEVAGGPTETASPTMSPSADGEPASDCEDLTNEARPTITIKIFKFVPRCFSTAAGAQLTVQNLDSTTHTFTVIDTQIDATILGGGAFHKGSEGLVAGDYAYFCRIHPSMKGTFKVV